MLLHDRAAAREVRDDASLHRELADAGLPRGVTPVFLGVLPADRRPGAQGAHPRPSALYPQHVVASAWENGFFVYDSAAAAAACKVPVLYIDAGTPNTDLSRFGELCPRLVTGKTVGSGHFVQLEVPEQVNAMIERFLAVALRDRNVAGSS